MALAFLHSYFVNGKQVIGVDTSITAITKAQAKFPHLRSKLVMSAAGPTI